MSDIEKQSHHAAPLSPTATATTTNGTAAGHGVDHLNNHPHNARQAHGSGGHHIPQLPVVSLDAFSGGKSPYLRELGNPAPLGLFSFASTTLILSLINAEARNVIVPNVVVGMALACGGLAQLLAGMWEFACGNTFGATAFSSYGAFWISLAIVYIPGFGIAEAYGENESEFHSALGYYLLTWFIFTLFMFLGSLRSNLALMALFFFLDMTFLLLFVSEFFYTHPGIKKAGGVFGCITAFIAYYAAASGLIHSKSSYFNLPVYDLPKRDE